MPDLHELATMLDAVDGSLNALRRQMRRRTQMLVLLVVVVVGVGVGVTVGTFLLSRSAFCNFFVDLQPPPGAPQPTGEYGRRILADARETANRLHCSST